VPAADVVARVKQLQAVRMAYDNLLSIEPELPEPASRIPMVVAADDMKRSILQSQSGIDSALDRLYSAQDQLKADETDLTDAKSLSVALDQRLEALESSQHEQLGKSRQDRYQQVSISRASKAKDYNRRIKELQAAIDSFVYDHLGAMLLAEELGGPVVGELADVDDDMLTAGFSAQGKPRKTSKASGRRQLRLDELWGFGHKVDDVPEPESELQAACQDMLGLIGTLYQALKGSSETGTYVQLPRDSAAARYLVRAKIAQYHPRDARRLKLIDFGRELD
jgi:Skp family chaperone for outer membrane proteins